MMRSLSGNIKSGRHFSPAAKRLFCRLPALSSLSALLSRSLPCSRSHRASPQTVLLSPRTIHLSLRDSITTTASTSQSTAEASEPAVTTASATLSELTTEPTTEPEQTETVYITRYGERYHKQNCSQIKNSIAFPTSLSEAVAEGYTPCKTCYK